MPIILEWFGYRTVKKLWPYVKPFSSDTGTLRMDGGRDRFAISISRVSMLTREKNSRVRRIHMPKPIVQQYQQCCHLANGNKTCRSLLLFKNNNVARGSQKFMPKFTKRGITCRATICAIFCHIRAWEQKVCGWGLKIRQISSLFGPPCSLRMTRKKSK